MTNSQIAITFALICIGGFSSGLFSYFFFKSQKMEQAGAEIFSIVAGAFSAVLMVPAGFAVLNWGGDSFGLIAVAACIPVIAAGYLILAIFALGFKSLLTKLSS